MTVLNLGIHLSYSDQAGQNALVVVEEVEGEQQKMLRGKVLRSRTSIVPGSVGQLALVALY